MSSTNPARRVLAALAVLTVALTVTASVLATVQSSSAAPTAEHRQAAPRTVVTILAPHCNGCSFSINQGIWDDTAPDGVRYWNGPSGTVRHGKLKLRVPSEHLRGASIAMTAPWEGRTGYTTTVAMRYAGHRVGDRVTVREARAARRATACFAGTDARALTLRLTTKRVPVEGTRGRTPGTLAYVKSTQEWLSPMRRTYHGVLGSQDLDVCGSKTGA
jgi:hypothetical protein